MTDKQQLEELMELGHVVDAWGESIHANPPKLSMIALVLNQLAKRAFTSAKNQYGALDESAYQVLKKKGVDETRLKTQFAAAQKSMKYRDSNLRVLSKFMSAKKARSYLPRIEDAQRLKDIADRNGLKGMKKLLSNSQVFKGFHAVNSVRPFFF